eukprot:UN26855
MSFSVFFVPYFIFIFVFYFTTRASLSRQILISLIFDFIGSTFSIIFAVNIIFRYF